MGDRDGYRTTSLPLAVFLYLKGQHLTGIVPLNFSKKEFEFTHSPDIEALVNTYRFGAADDAALQVSAREYERARNTLLDLLNE